MRASNFVKQFTAQPTLSTFKKQPAQQQASGKDTPADASNLTGQKVQKRQAIAQKRIDAQVEEPKKPVSPKPVPQKKVEIKSATLDKLNQFLCAKGGELTSPQKQRVEQQLEVKKDSKQESQPTAETANTSSAEKKDMARKDIRAELAQKLICTDPNSNQGSNKPLSKMTKKEQLNCRKKPTFLQKDNRVDLNQRRPSDPNFDPSTMYISPQDFAELSDGMKRYWEIKKENMDKLLLYRFGDWYVFYYDDLDIASKIIDLTVVPQPGIAQVGFEVNELDINIKKLTNAGHKVAVCEQTETREMMDKRLKDMMDVKKEEKEKLKQLAKEEKEKKKQIVVRSIQVKKLSSQVGEEEAPPAPKKVEKPKEDTEMKNEEQKDYDTSEIKAVRRSITNVFSKGTYNPSLQNDVKLDLGRSRGQCKAKVKYDEVMEDHDNMLAKQIMEQNENIRESFDDRYILVYCRRGPRLGFVFYDISILHFYFGCFKDPKTQINDFRTMVQTLKPVEVVTLYQENHKDLVKMMKNMQQRPIITYLTQDKLMDVPKLDDESRHYAQSNTNLDQYPDGLKMLFDEYFNADETTKHDMEVYMYSIGLSFTYMKEMMMADTSIPFASFRPYHGETEHSFLNTQTNMILDSATQESLEIFNMQAEDEDNEKLVCKSLVDLLDQTSTPFGRRLLRKWLSAPLTDVNQIHSRQEALQDLLDNFDTVKQFKDAMGKHKDLERMLARCYSYSIKSQQQIVYEELIWNLRLTEFRKTLQMLDQFIDLDIQLFEHQKEQFKSERLKNLVTLKNVAEPPPDDQQEAEDLRFELEGADGMFHNYTPILKPFNQCIQWEKVENDRFMPRPMGGMDDEIDEILKSMDHTKSLLNDYLNKQKKLFNCEKIQYASNRKYRYQLEIPNEWCEAIDECDEFFITARLKHVKRYLSSELTNLTTQLSTDELMYKARISPLIRDMFERFYHNREHWSSAVKCLAEVDALCALATVSNSANMVKPVIHPMCDRPFMKINQMRHPLIELTNENFVANDVEIDFDSQRSLLITGPNMGGKSTLLRTTCLIVIMAQMGCYVPADKCEMSVVDQIFTRVGANDKILENKSTFFLELEETKKIIDEATKHSLVIMDELGRGTSTFDGYSLAHSVLNLLLQKNQSRLLFTTHYHWLVDDFRAQQGVNLFTMLIDQKDGEDADMEDESNAVEVVQQNLNKRVSFLYKFVQGVSLSSFGVSVAQMAGVDKCILDRAQQKSSEFASMITMIKQKQKQHKEQQAV